MSDSTVGPRAEDAPSPEEVEPSTPTLPELSYGGKDALRWLKDTLQKGELRIPGTVEPRPIFGGADPALVGTEYAGIQVWAVPGAPVNEVYLLDLEALPKFDIGKYHFDVVFSEAMEDLLVQGRADVDPPSPETFALDLERFVMNTAPGLDARRDATTQVPEPQRAVCSMATIRAALDGFGEPAFGPPCFLCDVTPCICGRAR